jgi:hypothetical protein
MEFRYMGFEQRQNAREYRFDGLEKGGPIRHFLITVDLALFREHRVGIQEGPTLCAHKLAADVEKSLDGQHELTEEDLRAHTAARALAEARKAEARKGAPRKAAGAAAQANSPWRNSGF